MPFGQYRNQSIREIPSGYLKWLLANGSNLSSDLVEAVEAQLYARGLEALYERVKREKQQRRRERSLRGRLEIMKQQNRFCAQIILGNPGRYPGVMAEWAGVFLSRIKSPGRGTPG